MLRFACLNSAQPSLFLVCRRQHWSTCQRSSMMWSWCLIPRSSGNYSGNRCLLHAAHRASSLEDAIGCLRPTEINALDCVERMVLIRLSMEKALPVNSHYCVVVVEKIVYGTMGLWPNVFLVCLSVPVIKYQDESNMREKVFVPSSRYSPPWQGSQGSRN